ncbi:DUF4474 domain-containing protein [Vallitalea sp.]|jgi:hypothetical protein|uniref:DUF4474 domain-containing protein n=1 Tax=Vallitalea sp. TaxID=1882829 RepID=UPI0025E4487C|nr:DUF4474 domain-containing protein [Vallitalea sp.]MCT4687911.1 DUF4474 domain-containing protein [Vallitalea sp.]
MQTFGLIDTADIGAFFLMMEEDKKYKGVYHADFDCWQQYGGYNSLYDVVFDLGTSMETAKFQFTHKSQELRFWAWKGDYVNLGSGAELGIYKRLEAFGSSTPHWLVDKDLALPMSLKLEDNKGNTLIDYNPTKNQWWITGFNSNYKDINAENLTAYYTINFINHKDMYNNFIKSDDYLESKDKWSKDKDNKYQLTYKF